MAERPAFTFERADYVDLLRTDFAGLHAQHAGPVSTFNTMLQIVIVLEGIPWVVAGALLKDGDLADVFRSPLFLATMTFSAAVGIVGYQILVYNRLLINWYARALNSYRKFIVDGGIALPFPTDATKPSNEIETKDVMLLLRRALETINGAYLGVVAYELVKYPLRAWHAQPPVLYGAATLVAVAVFFLTHWGVETWRRGAGNPAR